MVSLLSLVLAATASAPRDAVSILDFDAANVGGSVVASIGAVAALELERLDVVDVITADSVRKLISTERQKQLLGAGDGPSLSQLGAMLNSRFVLTGRVSQLSGKISEAKRFTLELTLLEAAQGKRLKSEVSTFDTELALFQGVRSVIYRLVQPLLDGKTGQVVVISRETAAAVKVDETIVGTTPLARRVELKAGPHLVSVEKEGFVTETREVRVQPNAVAQVEVRLVPSPDFAASYERRAGATRLGAKLSLGAAIAGAAAAILGQVVATQRFGTSETPGTFAYHRAQLVNGPGQPGVNHLLEAQTISTQISSFETVSFIGLGVGIVAAVTATVLWIIGDPPGAYASYTTNPGVTP